LFAPSAEARIEPIRQTNGVFALNPDLISDPTVPPPDPKATLGHKPTVITQVSSHSPLKWRWLSIAQTGEPSQPISVTFATWQNGKTVYAEFTGSRSDFDRQVTKYARKHSRMIMFNLEKKMLIPRTCIEDASRTRKGQKLIFLVAEDDAQMFRDAELESDRIDS